MSTELLDDVEGLLKTGPSLTSCLMAACTTKFVDNEDKLLQVICRTCRR